MAENVTNVVHIAPGLYFISELFDIIDTVKEG